MFSLPNVLFCMCYEKLGVDSWLGLKELNKHDPIYNKLKHRLESKLYNYTQFSSHESKLAFQ